MIYQLARTSPLISGQVKLNMILNGPKVVDLQYVPLSKHIAFNYALPKDVLNYTYEENIRMLYNKTKDTFFKDIHNPKLSTESLYRSPGDYFCDTHDNSYEMSMRRLEYNRYSKQFEFFCPLWCDTKSEFENIEFYLTIANNAGRRLFKKRIDISKVKDHFVKFYRKTSDEDENKDLVYIDLKNCEARIKGLNAESGNLQTVDVSYITNTLLSCERTVMETDSLVASLFSANKIISTQLFNFSFIFNLEDFVPLYIINEISGDSINAFVDIYVHDGNELKQVEMRDLYTNYDFIPKYDIYKTAFTDNNVLDYMQDYNSVDLVNKNKLTQGIFHWALDSNKNEMFNVYNGFAPVNDGKNSCSGISNGITDMYTDTFDMNKNPFGLLKWKNIQDVTIMQMSQFLSEFDDESNYFAVDLNLENLKKNETQLFGNTVIDNTELLRKLQVYHDNIEEINKNLNLNNLYSNDNKEYIKTFADYVVFSENNRVISSDNKSVSKTYSDIKTLYAGLFFINDKFKFDDVKNFLPDWTVVRMEMLINYNQIGENKSKNRLRSSSSNSFIAIKFIENKFYIAFMTNDMDDNFIHSIFFRSLYAFDPVAYDAHLFCRGNNFDDLIYSIEGIKNYDEKYKINQKQENNDGSIVTYVEMDAQDIVYNSYALLCDVVKCAILPSIVTFKKSLTTNLLKAPKILSKELNYRRFITNIKLQRYDGNISPMFVALDSVFYNNTYWNKQYQKTIYNHILTFGNNNEITKFVKLADTKFSPVYRSLGYYCLNSAKTDYDNFYLDSYDGEKSWYKANSFVFLPVVFESELTKNVDEQITEDDITNCIYEQIKSHYKSESDTKTMIERWIYDLYQYKYTYDYVSETDISKMKYKITFNLK